MGARQFCQILEFLYKLNEKSYLFLNNIIKYLSNAGFPSSRQLPVASFLAASLTGVGPPVRLTPLPLGVRSFRIPYSFSGAI